jgi:hypothetical protein
MILVDFNNVVFAGIMAQLGEFGGKFEEGLIRHMVLTFILSYKRKYPGYGELVLCCDGGNPWRKDYFEHYKARRKAKPVEGEADEAAESDDSLDMEEFFRILNVVREEMKARMPYKVIQVYRTEGDDAIAVLAKHMPGPHVVISNDKDFTQLCKFDGLIHFSPLRKGEVKTANADMFLKEMIIRGDAGDDVPNILSDDDVFVVKEKRQKSIMAKKLVNWLVEPLEQNFDADKIERNRRMIDFEEIPQEYVDKILGEYESQKDKRITRQDIFGYFVAKKLSRMVDMIQHF